MGRCAPPVGHATALGNVVVDEVHGTRIEHPAHAVARDLRLPGVDGDARRSPHTDHAGHVVVPVAGLLEPGDVEGLYEARETDRLIHRPAAVGIDGKHKVLTRRLAGSGNALCILLRRQPADLELAAGHTGRPVELHLTGDVGVRLALHVVAADGDDWHRITISAYELTHAALGCLADHVPNGAVDAGDGLE